MKKLRLGMISMCLCALLFAGCGASTFSITSSPSKTTIKVNDAQDGATSETNLMGISKNKTINITSNLEKGSLVIDFVEAENIAASDEPEEIMIIGSAKAVTVGQGDEMSFSLERSADYQLQLTAVGETSGTVTITFTK